MAETATSTHVQLGEIQYVEPDTSHNPWNSTYMAAPLPKTVTQAIHPLHELQPSIFRSPSPYTLSTHAFTAIKHTSIMHSAHFTLSSFYEPSILVNHYIPEVEYLVKAVTEASVHSQLRTREKEEEDPNSKPDNSSSKPEMKRDVDLNKIVITTPNNANTKIGPARSMHIDTSPAGA
ncbi:hypothetical protein L207DRAFT_588828 [Hyaloscypha variabilis F]|uniref:Uncharacterized protein n=1 Tax=Hyaloscypha variabilis (strain UAMH 11265 / GT02V1 / F) TaxID=1149755 RepID=A0A2J6R6U3_HYAVF|nr:hypothetical protein L207DRAFT_588828 [Hyaloscypha variabilis F]